MGSFEELELPSKRRRIERLTTEATETIVLKGLPWGKKTTPLMG
jgi:hypothetical protein